MIDETDLIKTRLIHLFKDESTGSRRAMFTHAGATTLTIHLTEEDVSLLVFCGCEKKAFDPHQYTFRFERQPSVQLLEQKGVYTLYSALKDDTYLLKGQWNMLATKKQEITLDFLNSSVNGLIEKRKTERNESRSENQIIISPEDEALEDATIYSEVVQHIDATIDNYGKLLMAALWSFRQSGKFRSLPNKPDSITEVVRDLNLKNRDYDLTLSMVVDRIFADVDAAHKSGKPFVNPEEGNRSITVEMLIVTPGLIQKLTKSSDHYAKLIDRDSKQALLSAIMNGSVQQVKALREGQQVIEQIVPISIKVVPIKDSNKSRIELIVNDEAQLLAVRKLLKPLLGDVTQ